MYCTVYTVSVRNTVHRESHFQEYKLGRKNKEFYLRKSFKKLDWDHPQLIYFVLSFYSIDKVARTHKK